MDIDKLSYWQILPTVLSEIAASKCISIDLELSGIPQKLRQTSLGKQTLQERYVELKHAAETYFILQAGITCMKEDHDKKLYTVRSFNFDLSPMVPEYFGIDRTFAYSSGALQFLLDHDHTVQKPILEGIPYLKVSESKESLDHVLARLDQSSSIPDIDLSKQDEATITFVNRVRAELASWVKSNKHKTKSYTISGNETCSGQTSEPGVDLTRFEKRLVHQIVRADFPNYQTLSKPGYIEVKLKNPAEEARFRETKIEQRTNEISKQTGFRFVAEALAGQRMDELDLNHCHWEVKGQKFKSFALFESNMHEIRRTLTEHPRTLVGHNCFLDLVYFYSHFLGELPDTVEEFVQAVHSNFPLVIDTKFMATEDATNMDFKNSSLNDLEHILSYQEYPRIEQSSSGSTYVDGDQYHKAGYDSFVTMKVFLKLAARFDAAARMARRPVKEPVRPTDVDASNVPRSEADENAHPTPWEESSKKRKRRRKSKSTASEELSSGKFFHANPYAQLDGLAQGSDDRVVGAAGRTKLMDGAPVDVRPVHPSAETPISSSNAMPPSDGSIDVAALAKPPVWASHLIPPWEDEFWKTYGNKLRVYGTMEQECDLTMKPRAALGERQSIQGAPPQAGWVRWHLGRLLELLRRGF